MNRLRTIGLTPTELPSEISDAMRKLAAGDRDLHLDESGANAEFAAAFNRICAQLNAQRIIDSPPEVSGRETRDALRASCGTAEGAVFLAIITIDQFEGPIQSLDVTTQFLATQSICDDVAALLPAALVLQTSRSSLECSFMASDSSDAARQLSQLARRLEGQISQNDGAGRLTITVGFAEWSELDEPRYLVVDRAQHAVTKARAGHIKLAMFSEQDRIESAERKALARDLEHALPAGELSVNYQPKLNLRTQKIEAVEALVRWTHPIRGSVPPDDFIGLAEQIGAIRPLTEFVIAQSISDQARLKDQGLDIDIHVNISSALICDTNFVDSAIAAVGRAVGKIGFEITETAVIGDSERALNNALRCAEAGIPISIDDYGSGYSSLSYLKQFPAQELKIDKVFVLELTRSHRDPLIVRSTIDLAHALDMHVTAEGVEDAMCLALLQVMGCDTIQGFHLSRPLPCDALIDFLKDYAAKPAKTSPMNFQLNSISGKS